MTTTPGSTEDGSVADTAVDVPPPEAADTAVDTPPPVSEIDRLVDAISGEDDHVGMAALWRVTMDLDQWWFIAVGEPGDESPAAADIDDQLMLLTFTDGDRARHFAVAQGMIAPDDELSAIALRPDEVVATSQDYMEAGIDGLMFDPHISGYFISSDQLPVVHAAVRQPTA